MRDTKYQIGIVLYCLAGLLGTISCTLGCLYGVIARVKPDLLIDTDYVYLKNNDHYWRRQAVEYDPVFRVQVVRPRPPEAQITEKRQIALDYFRDWVREENEWTLPLCSIGLIVSLSVLVIAWRATRSMRPGKNIPPTIDGQRSRTWFERYLLVVSLLSFLGILSCLGVSIYGFVGVMDPDTFVSDYTLKEHESNIHYWLSVGQTFQGNRNRQTDLYPKPSEEELARRRAESLEDFREEERFDGWLTAIMGGAGLLSCLVVFLPHRRLGRELRRSFPLSQTPDPETAHGLQNQAMRSRGTKYQFSVILVCFVGLLGCIACTLGIFYGLINLAEPDLLLTQNYQWYWTKLKNNDHYWHEAGVIEDHPNSFRAKPHPTDSEVTRQREQELDRQRRLAQDEVDWFLPVCSGGLFISLLVSVVGWRESRPIRPTETTPAKSARTWFECYLLLVSFLSLLGILGCGAGTIAGLVHMFAPDSFLEEYVPNKHRNNDTYWRWIGQSFNRQHELYPRPSEEELTRKKAPERERLSGPGTKQGPADRDPERIRNAIVSGGTAHSLARCPKVTPNIPT